ncbi:TonB-dependent receptor [Kordiimonas marina]|uniref:TonB-dependent receptor n=1 Tax=Kordiimonas marina TaxID=2872312 RepID=UPI001FF53072|nr:TonB-dependent receptor [Kordiimonas marina]
MAIGTLTKLALVSTTALSGIGSTALLAADKDTTTKLDEIVVTATRRSERIEDIPYNISAVSGTRIDDFKMLDSAELLRSVSGVAVVDRGPRNAGTVNSIHIRGLNVDSNTLGDYATSSAPTVSTYINDTPIFANLMIKDLERVEVLRGPQGTLYGSGALGGTVRYITRKPDFDGFSGQVSGSLSSVKGSGSIGWSSDIVLNVPFSDTLAFRFAGTRQDYPGLTDYVNVYNLDANGIPIAPKGILDPTASYRSVKDADYYKAWFGRASLRWRPSDTFEVTATYTRQSDKSGGRRAQTVGKDGYGNPYGKYENGSVQLEPANSDTELGALEATLDLGFATLTSSSSLYNTHGSSISENTGYYAQNGWLGYYYNYPRPMASADRAYKDKAFVEEVRLVSSGDGPVSYVFGLYYQDQDRQATQHSYLRGAKDYIDALFGSDVPWVSGDQDFHYVLDENFKQKAAYGELTYKLSDKIDVTVGARYFKNESSSTTFMALPFYTDLFPELNSTFSNSESKILFKGNLTYHLSDDSLAYATWSQGYRRGGQNGVPTTGYFAESPAWLVYKSDRVDNYEIGFKGSAHDIRYNVSLFYVDWSDPQLNTATPVWGFFAVQNGSSAATKGIEVEIEGNLTPSIHYSMGYAYADAKLTSDFTSPVGSLIASDGAVLPGAPKHMFNVALDHTYAISDKAQLVSRIDGYFQSSARNAIGTSVRYDATLPAYSLWNGSVALVFDKFDVSLWVKNIFNAEGVSAIFKEELMGTAPDQGYYGNGSKQQIALPRTFGLSATYRF